MRRLARHDPGRTDDDPTRQLLPANLAFQRGEPVRPRTEREERVVLTRRPHPTWHTGAPSGFLRFHNAVVDHVRQESGLDAKADVLKEAQRLVRCHYQWIVVHDFLREHIVGPEIVDDILRPQKYKVARLPDAAQSPDTDAIGPVDISVLRTRLLFYKFYTEPFMPVEFSAAGYRYGHSMVHPSYFFNDFVRSHTEPNRTPIFSDDPDPLGTLSR